MTKARILLNTQNVYTHYIHIQMQKYRDVKLTLILRT